MLIEREDVLAELRQATECGWCKKPTPHGCDPHHLCTRGSGRVDAYFNLMPLCRACHTSHHAGNEPLREHLFAMQAVIWNCQQDDILCAVHMIRALPKKCTWEYAEYRIVSTCRDAVQVLCLPVVRAELLRVA